MCSDYCTYTIRNTNLFYFFFSKKEFLVEPAITLLNNNVGDFDVAKVRLVGRFSCRDCECSKYCRASSVYCHFP